MQESAVRVLSQLATEFSRVGISFQLGGSGLLCALGLVDRVGDLDLVFHSEARPVVASLLGRLTGEEPRFDSRQEPGFVSDWRCRHQLDEQKLDLAGGVAMEVDETVVRLPFRPGGEWVLSGVPIPLAPLEQWLLIYRVHGSSRADVLAPLVDPAAWAAQYDELSLSGRWAEL